jgi:predicted transport protein
MVSAIIANLPSKTGRTFEEWVALVRSQGSSSNKERIAWLKQEHGLGHVQAGIIVDKATKPDDYVEATSEELFEAQYAGVKSGLRPIYDRLAQAAQALGGDVTLDPRVTYVALNRRRQFGLIQPSTRTRVDLGLILPNTAPTSRLQPAGSFGSGRTTHRVAIASVGEVDGELLGWLRAAYDADA